MSKEQTVDCLVRIFESMTDNFGVGQVVEVIVHTPIAWWVRIGRGRVPGRRNRDAVGLMRALALCHFLFLAFLSVASIAFLTVRFMVLINSFSLGIYVFSYLMMTLCAS